MNAANGRPQDGLWLRCQQHDYTQPMEERACGVSRGSKASVSSAPPSAIRWCRRPAWSTITSSS